MRLRWVRHESRLAPARAVLALSWAASQLLLARTRLRLGLRGVFSTPLLMRCVRYSVTVTFSPSSRSERDRAVSLSVPDSLPMRDEDRSCGFEPL
jgi:hypothetical protein